MCFEAEDDFRLGLLPQRAARDLGRGAWGGGGPFVTDCAAVPRTQDGRCPHLHVEAPLEVAVRRQLHGELGENRADLIAVGQVQLTRRGVGAGGRRRVGPMANGRPP